MTTEGTQNKIHYKKGDWVTVKKEYRHSHSVYGRVVQVNSYDEQMGTIKYNILGMFTETIGIAYIRPARMWEKILAPIYNI